VFLRSRRGKSPETRLQLLKGLNVFKCEKVHLAADTLKKLYAVDDHLIDVNEGIKPDFGAALKVDSLESEKDF
jgi:hypothetical protein